MKPCIYCHRAFKPKRPSEKTCSRVCETLTQAAKRNKQQPKISANDFLRGAY